MNIADLSRWDALIAGYYTPITQEEKLGDGTKFDNKNFARFRASPSSRTQKKRDLIQGEFLSAIKNVVLSFRSARASVESGLPEEDERYTIGTMHRPTAFSGPATRLTLAFEVLEPLMCMNLTLAEQAIVLFRIAATLSHETTVCSFSTHLDILLMCQK